MLLNTVSVSATKMKHQSNLYVCWQPYTEFCRDCWNSRHNLTSFYVLVYSQLLGNVVYIL